MINCSQTKFVAIILVMSVFFMRFFAWPIFCLTLLIFRPLAPFSSVSAQTVLETYTYGVKGWREVEDTPHYWHPPPRPQLVNPTPPPQRWAALPPPPPSLVLEQKIVKNTQFYTNFLNFFQTFWNCLSVFEFFPP